MNRKGCEIMIPEEKLRAPVTLSSDDGSMDGIIFLMKPSDGSREIRIRSGMMVFQYVLDENNIKALKEWIQ